MSYVLANWKMFPTPSRAEALARRIQDGLRDRARDRVLPTVIVCPPFVALTAVRAAVDRRLVRLGAQNCHWEAAGPYTGEVSPPMLAEMVDYVLIGHSERRAAGETDEQIAWKVSAVAAAGLTPVLFVGEDQETDLPGGDTEQRLLQGLAGIDPATDEILVVYEPTWAIGGGRAADPGRVEEVVVRLKGRLRELGARRPEVIYGGTVSAGNVQELMAIDPLDGVGATRASLDARELLQIVDAVDRTTA